MTHYRLFLSVVATLATKLVITKDKKKRALGPKRVVWARFAHRHRHFPSCTRYNMSKVCKLIVSSSEKLQRKRKDTILLPMAQTSRFNSSELVLLAPAAISNPGLDVYVCKLTVSSEKLHRKKKDCVLMAQTSRNDPFWARFARCHRPFLTLCLHFRVST